MLNASIAAAFVACAPAANWLISNWGTVCVPHGPCLIPVGFGLMAPSGVLLIGLALVLRDEMHERLGRWWTLAAMILGGALGFAVAPASVATASAIAFVLAEMLDWAIYSRLRAQGRHWAVLGSGAAGALADSVLFSVIAFGSAKWAPGLWLAKIYASMAWSLWLATGKGRPA